MTTQKVVLGRTRSPSTYQTGYGPRAMKIDGNAKSCARMKKEPLVRRMDTPNITTKENPNTQGMTYSSRATKTDGDAKGRVGQVSTRSRRAPIRGL